MTSLYDFSVLNQNNQVTPLESYRGKVLLIVNTATGCGLTPQYKGLQELYDHYQDQGFEILDFPCNQFGKQAPGTAEEIHEFCQLKYDTSFPQFAKIEVNGANEHPLYTFLKSQKGGLLGKKIKWNFTKFLIDKDGNVIERFAPTVKPEDIDDKISAII